MTKTEIKLEKRFLRRFKKGVKARKATKAPIQVNRATALTIAKLAVALKITELISFLLSLPLRNDWAIYRARLILFLETGIPQFTILAEDNSKLPFANFSALPIVTCPGLGACLKFCYSLKAWRYPASLFRQVQNTILVLTRSAHLTGAFLALPLNSTFRLYVDGDFNSIETMVYWFELLRARPDIKAYGYSKSWDLFLTYAKQNSFPDNYRLNLSSGSKYPDAIKDQLKALSCYRGEFLAVKVSSKAPKEKGLWLKHAVEVRATAVANNFGKVWVCPGKCGQCTSHGHACGSDKFRNIPIAIGIH